MLYKINEHIKWKVFDEEVALINITTGECYSLDETSSLIWILISKKASYTEMMQVLKSKLDIGDSNIQEEIDSTLNLFKENTLIKESAD